MPAKTDTITASSTCVESELGSGLVVLDLEKNVYFRMNAVGMFVWRELGAAEDRSLSFDELASRLLRAFDVDEARGRADLAALIDRLASEGLVRISAEAESAAAPVREIAHAHARRS